MIFNLDGSVSPSIIDTQKELEGKLNIFNDKENFSLHELKDLRNHLLSQSDWIVTKAIETGVGISSDWKTYRQALRDLPSHTRAPNKFMIADWPLSPDESQYPEDAVRFIAEVRDPVGLGTTSWVGLTTTGDYYLQDIPESE